MSVLFKPWTNTAFRVVLFCLAAGAATFLGSLMVYARSPLGTSQQEPVEQPVQFDHRHHVADEGIDCRYCHATVERSPSAGIPPTATCLGCHSQIWNKSPLLDPVRKSFFTNRPIPWVRVHKLPDFVYFNHSIHVAKGVGCATCHGRVDEMAAVEQVHTLGMGWCLECHREPEKYLRPREEITSMTYQPSSVPEIQEALARQYEVHARTSCTTCHR